jgi:hypothetical protein
MFEYGFVHYRAIDYGHSFVIGGECFEDTGWLYRFLPHVPRRPR